jgi:hypothetical protein
MAGASNRSARIDAAVNVLKKKKADTSFRYVGHIK